MIKKVIFLTFILCALIPIKLLADESLLSCQEMKGSNVDKSNCLYDVLQQYEEKLSDFEKEKLRKAGVWDRDYQPHHIYKIDLYQSQNQSNEIYRQYIEAECSRVREIYLSGNGAGNAYATCKIDLIKKRLEYMRTQKD